MCRREGQREKVRGTEREREGERQGQREREWGTEREGREKGKNNMR